MLDLAHAFVCLDAMMDFPDAHGRTANGSRMGYIFFVFWATSAAHERNAAPTPAHPSRDALGPN